VQPDQAVPQEFALQFWNEDKTTIAGLILEAIGLLLRPKGAVWVTMLLSRACKIYQYMRLLQLREGYAFTTFLIKMVLASNAPPLLKVKV